MLVLLDLDGTLTDPYDGIAGCVVHALQTMGLAVPAAQQLRGFIGPPLQDSFAALGLDQHEVRRAVAHYRDRCTSTGLYENRVYPGIQQALIGLRDQGHLLAVATSKPTPFAERVVEHFGLSPFFELVGGATLDGTRSRKGDVIAHVLATLHADPRSSAMVGDREQDVHGGREHGLTTVGVRWGYAEAGELERAGPDHLVDAPDQLAPVLAAITALRPGPEAVTPQGRGAPATARP